MMKDAPATVMGKRVTVRRFCSSARPFSIHERFTERIFAGAEETGGVILSS
jgi:hypothetical protein